MTESADSLHCSMAYSYLALGDSYTIGEQVPLHESFPYQTIQLLREEQPFYAPEILAKTGWTTDELLHAMELTKFLTSYDVVSLLIGVNNQYRGRSVENYRTEFTSLLQRAIMLAGEKSARVFVISIPDWGVTPFAAERNPASIAMEIDQYNAACREIAIAHHAVFIEITTAQRADNTNEGFLAADGLHPSGKEYAKWARELASHINQVL